ncbi:chemotaxis protein CheE [Brevundimonas sp. GCM10030266]|uniref:chemotaxis protein CheE n=1 Tax=Brevundimonas sp. GCM10030266 TaxID=3273386 RepID=UPI00361E6B59
MNQVRTTRIVSPLAKQLARPGGRTIADAQRLADAGLQRHRAGVMDDIEGLIGRLEALCAAATPEAQGRIYGLASDLVDLAGFFDTGPLYTAGYSLCDLSERMQTTGVWNWPAVEVHVKALRLIHAGGCREGAESDVLLQGLRSVLAAFTPD